MKAEHIKVMKKCRCTVCRKKIIDGTYVQVVRNPDGKIKAYLCLPSCVAKYNSDKEDAPNGDEKL